MRRPSLMAGALALLAFLRPVPVVVWYIQIERAMALAES